MIRAAWTVAVLGLAACARRPVSSSPDVPAPRDAVAVDVAFAPDVPHETVGRGARGPWSDPRLAGAAVSPAVVTADGRVLGLVAVPAEDLSRARLSWVSWGASGASIIAQADAPTLAPGAAVGLVPRPDGWTAVWSSPVDGGSTTLAVDLTNAGFAGAARPAIESEQNASQWALQTMLRRNRDRLEIPPADLTRNGIRARTERRGVDTVVRVDDAEVLRGPDLTGYAHAMDVANRGETRYLAISRGRCRDTRVELWTLGATGAQLRASFPIGVEVGVRWIRVEPGARAVALSWYQDLIPLRIPCARGDGGVTTREHGVRVALVVE